MIYGYCVIDTFFAIVETQSRIVNRFGLSPIMKVLKRMRTRIMCYNSLAMPQTKLGALNLSVISMQNNYPQSFGSRIIRVLHFV